MVGEPLEVMVREVNYLRARELDLDSLIARTCRALDCEGSAHVLDEVAADTVRRLERVCEEVISLGAFACRGCACEAPLVPVGSEARYCAWCGGRLR